MKRLKKAENDLEYYIENDEDVPYDLLETLDEPIGTTFCTENLEFTNRDYPFVILEGEIIKGRKGQTHSQLVGEYIKEHYSDGPKITKVFRSEAEDALDELGLKEVAFGHVMNNMAFIDSVQNCSVSDFCDDLKSELGVKKVYDSTETWSDFMINTRAARLQKHAGELVSFDELKKKKDNVGDVTKTKYLDYNNRDYPFIVIEDDLVLKGRSGETHSQLLQRFVNEHKDDLPEMAKASDWLRGTFGRNDAIIVFNRVLDVYEMAFGHVKDNMAFVDSTQNCTVSGISNLIKSELGVDKVYDSESHGKEFDNKRVARLKKRL